MHLYEGNLLPIGERQTLMQKKLQDYSKDLMSFGLSIILFELTSPLNKYLLSLLELLILV